MMHDFMSVRIFRHRPRVPGYLISHSGRWPEKGPPPMKYHFNMFLSEVGHYYFLYSSRKLSKLSNPRLAYIQKERTL